MHKSYRKNGWLLFSDASSRDIIERLATRKAVYLSAVSEIVAETRSVELTTFTSERLVEFELAKSIIRSLLRYNSDVLLLERSISRWFCESFPRSHRAIYYTLPYPIIHFPRDASEAGSFHTDSYPYIDESHTIWIPLNPCYGKPISIMVGSHRHHERADRRIIAKIRRFLSSGDEQLQIFDRLVSPDIPLGHSLMWHGHTQHVGNLNTTGQPTVALVIRITSHPVMSEPTCTLETLDHLPTRDDDMDVYDFARGFLTLQEEIDVMQNRSTYSRLSLVNLLEEAIAKVESLPLNARERKAMSFSMSMLSQRLETVQDSSLYALFASLLGQENIISLIRFLNHSVGRYEVEDIIAFLETYLDRYGSAQAAFLIEEFAIRYHDRLNEWKPSQKNLQLLTQ